MAWQLLLADGQIVTSDERDWTDLAQWRVYYAPQLEERREVCELRAPALQLALQYAGQQLVLKSPLRSGVRFWRESRAASNGALTIPLSECVGYAIDDQSALTDGIQNEVGLRVTLGALGEITIEQLLYAGDASWIDAAAAELLR